jgi:hypothetical protein
MHRMWLFVSCVVAAGALVTAGAAFADTHAPSAETFTLTCGGATITVVSPTGYAEAAQVVGTTGASVLEFVTDSAGNVLFEQPSYPALSASKLTTCTADGLTFVVLNTPQR